VKVDDRGLLVRADGDPAAQQFPTVRTYPLAVPEPLGIVWHTTDERGGPGYAEALARRIQTFRNGVDRPASWHLLIAKDGAMYQSAPFTVGTWHVGVPGTIAGRRFTNVNLATGGIELENAGRLRKIGTRVYCWPFVLNPRDPITAWRPDPACEVEAERAVVTRIGLFDAFTPAQEAAAAVVIRALATRYGWTRDACAYCHVDFDPEHREDPGPIWKETILPRVLTRVFGESTAEAPSTGVPG
jgi:N-acetyl-anhydromuramyl-L-alanine amidase AmpD